MIQRHTCNLQFVWGSLTYCFLSALLGLGTPWQSDTAMTDSSSCGGFINGSEVTHGIIQSPNFPKEFPTPIHCYWILYNPKGKKIVLYFTQFYLREGFTLTQYDFYQDETSNKGKDDRPGEIDHEDNYIWVTVYKPYLKIDFDVSVLGNIHLRVKEFLLEVYGFNITYEIVKEEVPKHSNACTVSMCSYLGNCFASANFDSFRCHCFQEYFGDQCQYGPSCDPEKEVNNCKNGGKCRFVYGSGVNVCQCPPQYHGVLCETRREDYVTSECSALGCSQKCEPNQQGQKRCTCDEGYRLTSDNRTCKEKGRMRFEGEVRCSPHPLFPITSMDLEKLCPGFRPNFMHKVTDYVSPTLQDFQNMTVIGIRDHCQYMFIKFYFIGERVEKYKVRHRLEELIRDFSVCDCDMDNDYLQLDAQPALHAMSLDNPDRRPALEGHMLMLVCKAKGSQNLDFRWFKEGQVIDISRTSRNMWESRIPGSDGETQSSVLNIGKAHPLDAGTYGCQAADWNETQWENLTVQVMQRPHIEVKPLAVSVVQGDSVIFTCVSLNDNENRGDFKYTWIRGDLGVKVGSVETANGEVVEDLFPIGSRLRLKEARVPQTYTCVINGSSGRASESCHVHIVENNERAQFCDSVVYHSVVWSRTAENATDIQLCPNKDGVKTPKKGRRKPKCRQCAKATRMCQCTSAGACVWDEPNFAACTSPHLEAMFRNLQQLQLGFLVNDSLQLFQKLQRFLRYIDTARPYIGDLGLAAQIVYGIHDYSQRYKDAQPKLPAPGIEDLINMASVIISRARAGNQQEKEVVAIGESIMKLMDSISKDNRFNISLNNQHQVLLTENIEVYSERIDDLVVRNLPLHTKKDVEMFLSSTKSRYLSLKRRQAAPKIHNISHPGPKEFMQVVVTVYKDLPSVMPVKLLRKQQLRVNSVVLTAGMTYNFSKTEKPQQYHILIRFPHLNQVSPKLVSNGTICVHWEFSEWTLPSNPEPPSAGHWGRNRCVISRIGENYTWCECPIPGHFSLLIPTDMPQMMLIPRPVVNTVTVAGATISLTGFTATIIVYMLFWRSIDDINKALTLNFCGTMVLLNSIIITGFTHTDILIMCRVSTLLLYLLSLAAIIGTVMEMVTMYLQHIRKSCFIMTNIKAILFTWGLSITMLIIVLICAETVGYSNTTDKYCLLRVGVWEMYAFVAPAGVLLVAYATFFCLVIRATICMKHQGNNNDNKKYMYFLCRSVLVLSCLGVASFLCLLFVNSTQLIVEYTFATLLALLGIASFIATCVRNAKGCKICICDTICGVFCQNCQVGSVSKQTASGQILASGKNETANSFKTFVRPQTSDPCSASAVEELEPDDPSLRDQRRYTREHKDQLRALLGSSSTAASAAGSGSDSGGSKESNTSCVSRSTYGSQMDVFDTPRHGHINWPSASRAKLHQNPLCNCKACTRRLNSSILSLRPARGKSYIVEDPSDGETSAPLLLAPHLRISAEIPIPFPELTPQNGMEGVPGTSGLQKQNQKRNKKKGFNYIQNNGCLDTDEMQGSPPVFELTPLSKKGHIVLVEQDGSSGNYHTYKEYKEEEEESGGKNR